LYLGVIVVHLHFVVTEVTLLELITLSDTPSTTVAVPWLRWLVAVLSPRRTGFAPASVNTEFVVDEVALEQVFSEFFGSPQSTSFHCGSPWSYITWG
jgi:hypothetical protein